MGWREIALSPALSSLLPARRRPALQGDLHWGAGVASSLGKQTPFCRIPPFAFLAFHPAPVAVPPKPPGRTAAFAGPPARAHRECPGARACAGVPLRNRGMKGLTVKLRMHGLHTQRDPPPGHTPLGCHGPISVEPCRPIMGRSDAPWCPKGRTGKPHRWHGISKPWSWDSSLLSLIFFSRISNLRQTTR